MTDAVTVSDEKLSMEELRELFGESIPMAAVRLIWPEFFEGVPHYDPLPILREKLKAIAVSALQQRREREGGQEPVAWQWSDFSGLWYTVDTARGTLADQEAIARMAAEKHEGRLRPIFASPTSPTEVKTLREALKDLVRGYVSLLESGRDRMRDFGVECDPVDVMEANDPVLIRARSTLQEVRDER